MFNIPIHFASDNVTVLCKMKMSDNYVFKAVKGMRVHNEPFCSYDISYLIITDYLYLFAFPSPNHRSVKLLIYYSNYNHISIPYYSCKQACRLELSYIEGCRNFIQ